jgi:hypothetical protein
MRPLLVGALFVTLLLCACARTPDEQRIREAMTAMQHAMEAHHPKDFLAYIDTDFVGNGGSGSEAIFDRAGLANLLRVEVLRNDSVGVTMGPIDIEMQGDRATAHVVTTFTGGSGGLLPEHGAIYAITSGWKKVDGNWRCYNATWSQKL